MSHFKDMADLLAVYAESVPKCCSGHCFMRLFDRSPESLAATDYGNDVNFVKFLNSPDWQGFDIKSALKVWLTTYSERSGMTFGDFVEAMQ